MSALALRQQEFLACLLDDATPLPAGWDTRRVAGMAVYRNAYRTRLIDALRETFERTAQLVGEDAFRRAAAHHLITNPPTGWTIDLTGERFAETCAELFAHDPDVAEVACSARRPSRRRWNACLDQDMPCSGGKKSGLCLCSSPNKTGAPWRVCSAGARSAKCARLSRKRSALPKLRRALARCCWAGSNWV